MKYFSLILLCLLVAAEVHAGIRALGADTNTTGARSTDNNNTTSENTNTAPVVSLQGSNTAVICNNNGFTMKECPSGYAPVYPCPQNNKYFRDCCPQEYRYTTANCYEKGLTPSTETCLGFHACRTANAEK